MFHSNRTLLPKRTPYHLDLSSTPPGLGQARMSPGWKSMSWKSLSRKTTLLSYGCRRKCAHIALTALQTSLFDKPLTKLPWPEMAHTRKVWGTQQNLEWMAAALLMRCRPPRMLVPILDLKWIQSVCDLYPMYVYVSQSKECLDFFRKYEKKNYSMNNQDGSPMPRLQG